MTSYAEQVEAVERIASLTNVMRVRREDAKRIENNGGLNGEMAAKVAVVAKDLRNFADRLEKAIK